MESPFERSHREDLVGKRVTVKWKKGKKFTGRVAEFDRNDGTHRIVYDDGDVRWYTMSGKTYWEEGEAGFEDMGKASSTTTSSTTTSSMTTSSTTTSSTISAGSTSWYGNSYTYTPQFQVE